MLKLHGSIDEGAKATMAEYSFMILYSLSSRNCIKKARMNDNRQISTIWLGDSVAIIEGNIIQYLGSARRVFGNRVLFNGDKVHGAR